MAKAFAENEYKSYVYIDFSNTSEDIRKLFENLTDLDRFFFTLSFRFGVTLHEREERFSQCVYTTIKDHTGHD